MTAKKIQGPVAALLSSRTVSGRLDTTALIENARFVLDAGAIGVCLSGATGEYVCATEEERVHAVRRVRDAVPEDRLILAGTGAPDLAAALRIAHQFEAAGADVLLVPPPHFFPYPQAEIEEFYRVFADATPLPVVIYNLPSFTSGVSLPVVLRLIESVPNIVGVKDSSGETGTLRALTQHPELDARRIIGNDGVFRTVICESLCDGCISGVAGVLPELTVACFQEAPLAPLALLEELIPKLAPFPTPWGLKLIAEARGFFHARYSMPVPAATQAEMAKFQEWFGPWWRAAQSTLASSSPAVADLR